LLVEVFEYGGVGVVPVEKILRLQVPVVCVGKVARVKYKVVGINGAGEGGDGGVV
jgi:hypothetical protein